jgi:hypothetical protein
MNLSFVKPKKHEVSMELCLDNVLRYSHSEGKERWLGQDDTQMDFKK